MKEDYRLFREKVQYSVDGEMLNPVKIKGAEDGDVKSIGAKLNEYAERLRTKDEHLPIGELYGFTITAKSEASIKDNFEFIDNRFFVSGQSGIKYTYNNGHIAQDPKLASMNSLNALEKIPKVLETHEREIKRLSVDIPVLQSLVKGEWRKEDELKSLKASLSELERKIAVSLKPVDQHDEKTDVKQEAHTEVTATTEKEYKGMRMG